MELKLLHFTLKYIDKMNLQAFVNDNYDVLDISTGQTEIIQDFISR